MTELSRKGAKKSRQAIFGGSFDPVHRGHLAMADTAREAVGLDRLVFVPCAVSPFKTGTVATEEQRFRMLELAIEDMGMEWASLSDFEVSRPAPSYSWQTARHFSKSNPETEWHWILGTDQWNQIDRWAEPEQLRELLHFIVLTREGSGVLDRPGWRYTPVPFEHPASSSAIRANFGDHQEWLTEGVVRFCEEEGLYGRSGMPFGEHH